MNLYDRAGLPITLDEYMQLYTTEYPLVRRTPIRRFLVSTVWLGLDPGWGTGLPLIYETMIFSYDRRSRKWGNPFDPQWRYPTERWAVRGHSEVCRMVHSGWRGDRNG